MWQNGASNRDQRITPSEPKFIAKRIHRSCDAYALSAVKSIFGGVVGAAPVVQIEAIPNTDGVLVLPQHVPYALSTDGQL